MLSLTADEDTEKRKLENGKINLKIKEEGRMRHKEQRDSNLKKD